MEDINNMQKEIKIVKFDDIKDKIENVKIIANYYSHIDNKEHMIDRHYIFINYEELKWLMENKIWQEDGSE